MSIRYALVLFIALGMLLPLSSCPFPFPCEQEGEGEEGENIEGECQEDTSLVPDYSWEAVDINGTSETYHPEFLTASIGIGFRDYTTPEQRMAVMSIIPCIDPSAPGFSEDTVEWIRVICPTQSCTTKAEILGAVAQLNHIPEIVYASPMFSISGGEPRPVTNYIEIIFPLNISGMEIEAIENRYKLNRLDCFDLEATEVKICRFESMQIFAPDTIMLAVLIRHEPNVLNAHVYWDIEISLDKKTKHSGATFASRKMLSSF